ncbi:AIR synthase-related protein [Butyrivibrio sp. AE3004]|uniref:AIR synthase-related protein n=1 Tax=Butyrivibrio sp. AE3004 TaxID=1506994 RepID=UPI00049418CE|nr:AIR synthase-related protein [Butyrivibrio sp. AE3004]
MRIGKVTESVLKRSVLKLIKNDSNRESAAAKSDCAYSIDEFGRMTFSSVDTITFRCKESGYLAVINAANNIFCSGGKPLMASLNIMLPTETEETEIKEIMKNAISATNELEIAIEGGHTEVTDAVNRPLISAVVVGTGTKITEQGKIKDSCDVIMTKWTGLEGTAILASEKSEELDRRLPAYMIREAAEFKRYVSIKQDAAVAMDAGALFMHDVSRGGIFAALWEIAERAGCGMDIDLKKIPIRQETVEISNYLGVNPYQMMSGGSLLIIASDGEDMIAKLEEAGVCATKIGITTAKNDRIIRNDDEIRYLDKPQADEIVRIMV